MPAIVVRGMMGLVVLILAACAGPLKFENVSSTNTVAQDHRDCTVEWDHSGQGIAYAADPLGHASYIIQARQDLVSCMERKGWKRVE